MNAIDRQLTTGIYIGRFQPLHNEHHRIMEKMSKIHDVNIVFIGSADRCLTKRNPFTYAERRKMILKCFPNFRIYPAYDFPGDDLLWRDSVVKRVDACPIHITLHGCNKDATSNYFDLFPWYKCLVDIQYPTNATEIRELYFVHGIVKDVPEAVKKYMNNYKYRNEFVENKLNWR